MDVPKGKFKANMNDLGRKSAKVGGGGGQLPPCPPGEKCPDYKIESIYIEEVHNYSGKIKVICLDGFLVFIQC